MLFLFPFYSKGADHCASYSLKNFKEEKLEERIHLAALNHYKNLFPRSASIDLEKVKTFKSGTLFANQFTHGDKKMVLYFDQRSHLLSVVENGKSLYCEKKP